MSGRAVRLALHEIPSPPLPLKEVAAAHGNKALVVWCALEELASAYGKTMFTIKMRKLAHLTGITRKATLSSALTLLNNAGWAYCHQRMYVRNGKTRSCTRVIMLHNVNRPPVSKKVKKALWLPLYRKLYEEQVDEVKQLLEHATHIWLCECMLNVALPFDLYVDSSDVLDRFRPVGPYGLFPETDANKPSYALSLKEEENEVQQASDVPRDTQA
jgi:hypothetical protein